MYIFSVERCEWKALQNLQQYFLMEPLKMVLTDNIYVMQSYNPTDSNDPFWREKEKSVAKVYV